MFAAAIVLRYKMPQAQRPFRIGKKNGLLWIVAGLGFLGSLVAFILSFVPPGQIATGSNTVWFSVLIIGCIVVVVIPFIIYALRKPSWQDPDAASHFAPFSWEKRPVAEAVSSVNGHVVSDQSAVVSKGINNIPKQ